MTRTCRIPAARGPEGAGWLGRGREGRIARFGAIGSATRAIQILLLGTAIVACAPVPEETAPRTGLDLRAATPDTVRDDAPAPLLAPDPVSDRQAEAIALMDRLSLAYPTSDARGEAPQRPVAFDQMGDRDLSLWFGAQRDVVQRTPADELEDFLLAATDSEPTAYAARRPTAEQTSAVSRVLSLALGPVSELTWNDRTGTPQHLVAPLFLQRGTSGAEAARAFLAANDATIRALLGADERDELRFATTSTTHPYEVEDVIYYRYRDGLLVDNDSVHVFVSTRDGRYGAGLVEELYFVWSREATDVDALANAVSEERAREIAGRALHAELAGRESAEASLRVRCDQTRSERPCRAVWEIRWLARFAGEDGGERRDDEAWIDAQTGELVLTRESTRHYSGSVNVTSNFPYDTADTFRDFPYGRLAANSGATFLDGTGQYTNWTPGTDTTALAVMSSLTAPGTASELRVVNADNCAAAGAIFNNSVPLGGTYNLSVAPGGVGPLAPRHAMLMWGWYSWANEIGSYLTNYIEMPSLHRYAIGVGTGGTAGGHTYVCDGPNSITISAMATTDDSIAATAFIRDELAMHEHGHAIDFCTTPYGGAAGCVGWPVVPRTAWPDGMIEGHPEGWSHWAGAYESGVSGEGTHPYDRFAGPNVAGDVMLYDEEIDGTSTPANVSTSCRDPSNNYVCNNATEACWSWAMNRPRCMRRASSLAQCQMMFMTQPWVDWQTYGTDSAGNGGIGICVSNGYTNGLAYSILANSLSGGGGFLGLATYMTLGRDATAFTELTQTSDNLHALAALRGSRYEVTEAFHSLSTESFGWLDDTTNDIIAAELTRPARGSILLFNQGGPTGTSLAFQTASDADAFQIPVARSSTWSIQATTASSSVDLCIYVYGSDGTYLGAAAGCTDGSSTSTLRNASISVSTGNRDRLVAVVSNVLGLTGTYDVRVSNSGDDYPAGLASAYSAEPLAPGAARSGVINVAGDGDLFRYDRPAAAGTSPLSFTVAGLASPSLEVWYSTGTTVPSGPAGWTGTSSVSVASPAVGHYYVRVSATSGTGSYSLSMTTCGGTNVACSDHGTYASPLSLPTTGGGFVWERLETAGGANNQFDCDNGTTCDWYQMDLAANERISATIYDAYDASCGLELAIYAPPDELYFTGGGGEHYPALIDLGGSMETNGAQLEYVARHAGTHRIRVRTATSLNCPRYVLGVARGRTDTGYSAPPPIH